MIVRLRRIDKLCQPEYGLPGLELTYRDLCIKANQKLPTYCSAYRTLLTKVERAGERFSGATAIELGFDIQH